MIYSCNTTFAFCLFGFLVKYDSGALGFRASKGHFFESGHPFCFTKQPLFLLLQSSKVVVFIMCIKHKSLDSMKQVNNYWKK